MPLTFVIEKVWLEALHNPYEGPVITEGVAGIFLDIFKKRIGPAPQLLFATTFNDGIGVPVVSPWQVSRAAQLEAERVGYYTLASLAETAEATNSSDVVISMLAQDTTDRYGTAKGQILKNRDGEKGDPVPLQVDFATSCFVDASLVGSSDSGFSQENKFGGLLDSDW